MYADLRRTYSPAVLALGGAVLHNTVHVLHYVNLVAYVALGGVTLLFWLRRRDRPTMWAAIAFGSLGLLELLSLIPNHAGNLPERAVGRVVIALLVVFPYFLFRFTNAFRAANRRLANGLFVLSAILVVWTFALPRIPQQGQHRGGAFQAFVTVFFIHWAVLSIVSASSLWRAGRAQPTVARRRMQFLALATGFLTLALLLAVFTTNQYSGLSLGSGILALISVVAFLLGFAPPQILRILWRAPEQARVQQAIASLLTFAKSQQEVASRVLEPAANIVGARAIAIRNGEGGIVAAWNVPDSGLANLERGDVAPALWDDATVVNIDVADGSSMVVWTSPYAPVFGDEELRLLRTLGALTGLALDRVRLFQAEHETRIALERADEVKTNFIALAAHELRTPVTTIHGFVMTLHHLADRLDDEQRTSVRVALLQQTQRMVRLVEQLLDLSRLDAESIDIEPERVNVHSQLEEIIHTAAADPAAVHIDMPPDTIAIVDRNALERILTNLVTNAFRYGVPPVRVHAEQTDRHFRLTVEDVGSGVPPEFVPDLFERFTRSKGSRSVAGGTGLGLAIARSYARAHGGDLVYEDVDPHGACFRLVLPMGRKELT
jgi:signal transduction histidine kinase